MFGLCTAYDRWASLVTAGNAELANAKKEAMENLKRAMAHVPVTIYYKNIDGGNVSEVLFLVGFQHREDYKKAEEAQAHGGWEVLLAYAHSRAMLIGTGAIRDGSDEEAAVAAVATVFSKIGYAKGSEYAIKNAAEKEPVTKALRAHDRFLAASLDHVMRKAHLYLAPKGPLDQVSKICEFSHKAATMKQGGLARLAHIFYQRLSSGAWPSDMAKTTLRVTYIPSAVALVKIVEHVRDAFTHVPGSKDLAAFDLFVAPTNPWNDQAQLPTFAPNDLFALRRSTRSLLTFLETLFTGGWDTELKQAAGETICLCKTGKDLFELERFGGMPIVEMYQAEERARTQVAAAVPAADAAASASIGLEDDDDFLPSQASRTSQNRVAEKDYRQLNAMAALKLRKFQRSLVLRAEGQGRVRVSYSHTGGGARASTCFI